MKQLHKLVIRSFIGPFLLTFSLSIFLLVMQFLWKYVDDLMGKGLEWYVLLELLFYASASLVIMALPLAILLSTIMTMGNLGESSEITAMKSAGLSLMRIMHPLTMSIGTIAICAFLFANHVWPVANLKFKSLLWDVTRKKPTINLQEKIFYNGIEGYSIRVQEKTPRTNKLKDILIYDHSKAYRGNRKVIRAERGSMERGNNGRYLILTLLDGISYEEMKTKKRGDHDHPHMKAAFDKQVIRFDLMDFQLKRSKEGLFSQDSEMMGIDQLSHMADSIQGTARELKRKYKGYLDEKFHIFRHDSLKENIEQASPPASAIAAYDDTEKDVKKAAINQAIERARDIKSYIEDQSRYLENKHKFMTRYEIEWHRKFTFPMACVVLFLIGAPVGAISRKGGLGMPVVFSIILFLVYHVVSMIGEKMVKSMVLEPWQGMWLSTILLLPVGIFLAYKANRDAKILDINFPPAFWTRFLKKRTSHEDPSTVS